MTDRWFTLGLNAEQWAIGPLDIGRKNGGVFPRIGPNLQLVAFQEAVREALLDVEPLPPGEYSLTFYIWRSRDTYEGTRKKVKKSQVDATNIQKGLEDALQGVLFGNDRSVRDVRTVVVEQHADVTPRIAIRASVWVGFNPDELPQFVWDKLDECTEAPEPQLQIWRGPNDDNTPSF